MNNFYSLMDCYNIWIGLAICAKEVNAAVDPILFARTNEDQSIKALDCSDINPRLKLPLQYVKLWTKLKVLSKVQIQEVVLISSM
jgi:hypothetical protein